MPDELQRIEHSAEAEIAAAQNLGELESRRIQFLGREKGALTLILRRIKEFPPSERKAVGERANRLREKVESLLEAAEKRLKHAEHEMVLKRERLDVTLPGKRPERGHLHPITKILREIEAIFSSMGFTVAEGPEVETEWYNFDALNIPKNHPARDMWDTFWLKGLEAKLNASEERKTKRNLRLSLRNSFASKLLLRTHTSPVQIRYMETHNPPIRIISPGRCYRYEATDASHEIQFYQLEGLMVDKNISIANFKAIIQQFFSRLFGQAMEVRLRPSYFPFTEPSFEVDIRKTPTSHLPPPTSQWIEIAGAGMVHPNVFKAVGYNPPPAGGWQGFAFGMGVDRIAMMKYKIPDIRLFHSGDLRFLKQF